MSEIPEVFAIFEQKLAHVLSFTVVPLKSKDLKNALEEILTYFSSIVERASKAESRIAELEYQLEDWTNNGWAEDYKARIAELERMKKTADENLLEAGMSVDLYFGSDTPDVMADTIMSLRDRIAELEAERLELRKILGWAYDLDEYKDNPEEREG